VFEFEYNITKKTDFFQILLMNGVIKNSIFVISMKAYTLFNLIFVFFIIFLFSSCHSTNFQNEGKTVFRYNEATGISSLDPAFSKAQPSIWAANQLFNGLVQLDDELYVKPCIAKKWDIKENGCLYRFYLRQDVFFHAHEVFGREQTRKVVASDFSYSFSRLVDTPTASPGAWIFNIVERDSLGVYAFKAVNDSVFEIRLKQAFPPFLGLLSMQYCSVLPEEVVELYGVDFRKNPIGTGPFTFKMWKEDQKLILLKNENYFEVDEEGAKLPFLDAVSISFIIDKQTAFLEFVKGNLDFLSGIDASYKDELLTARGKLNPKYHSKFKLYTQPYLNTEYLGFQMDSNLVKQDPLKLKLIRQAINYGFDRKKMMKYLRNDIGEPGIYGFIPKGLPGFDSTLTNGYQYNPEKSIALLEEAGFSKGKGLPEIKLSTSAAYVDLCKYIQHQLEDVGITIDIDVNPSSTLRELVGHSKVDFFRASWLADYPDAENYLSLFYSANYSPSGPNYTHFSNPKYDLLYEEAMNEHNDSLRYDLYKQMNELIIDESPVVILYYDQVLRFAPHYVKGLGSNAMNLLDLKGVKIERPK